MKIALFGATGLTGPSVLKEALARGHEVVALARNPSAITFLLDHVEDATFVRVTPSVSN